MTEYDKRAMKLLTALVAPGFLAMGILWIVHLAGFFEPSVEATDLRCPTPIPSGNWDGAGFLIDDFVTIGASVFDELDGHEVYVVSAPAPSGPGCVFVYYRVTRGETSVQGD